VRYVEEARQRRGTSPGSIGNVVELFAGVGGFRLGLEPSGWEVVWANQWEPSTKGQHGFDCYVSRYRTGVHVNEDINLVLDEIEAGTRESIPDHDLLVGGFPCQDYSVAKVLSQAHGIEGKKGVLWWAIYRILEDKRPGLVFLENVDRLIKSPATQRGRDFAIMLACLSDLGYFVEWRMVNAAEYGFPQRRRRALIVAHLLDEPGWSGPLPWIYSEGVLARALPVEPADGTVIALDGTDVPDLRLRGHPAQITEEFGSTTQVTPFLGAGVMWKRDVWTRTVVARHEGPYRTLGEVLEPTENVPERFFIPKDKLSQWRYLKGAKREPRTAANGHTYFYNEGAILFPDPLDQPSRTILTGEGGASPSRFKHVVQTEDGRFRRLMPVELERLNGFPDGWTDTGMSEGRRAFMMGNALVVGLVERVGGALREVDAGLSRRSAVVAATP
jgi:DNA (cytosine-5)-methyltransferase 1